MPKVLIKHQTGSKARQTDLLDFMASREVLIGRDQSCAIAYDENLDETISRRHARIVQDSNDASLFTIENFSSNGTFVNDQRIAVPTLLTHGSSVRFGATGPSFIFEIDPPPVPSGPRPTEFDFGNGKSKATRIVIKHKTGSKAARTEEFDLTKSHEILIGRDPACALIYDENVDKTVSREHARIVQDSADPRRFTVENLSQNNGTFVQAHKISTPAPLRHGDLVKLGPSGPSFIFEIDPPPPPKATLADLGEATGANNGVKSEQPWWVRKQTMADSLSTDDKNWNPAKILLLSAVALLVLVVGVGVFLFATRPRDSAGILEADGQAAVFIEENWRLFDPESGRQAYHWYVQNPMDDGGGRLPVFIHMTDGSIEPVLILDDERDTNLAIGGQARGSGCVVHPNGFILTSGAVAAPFNSPYTWKNETPPAVLIDPADHSVSLLKELPEAWIPSSARFVITRRTTIEDLKKGLGEPTGRGLQGRLDTISIGIAGNESGISAKLVGMSANHRMALFKADPLQPLHSVTVTATSTHLAAADPTYVIGYPLKSAASQKASIRLASVVKIADGGPGQGSSPCPDCYQISDSGADLGFSGGPVFDDHGRLVGVFLPRNGPQEKTFAVIPVEQAADLLGLSRK